MPSASPAVAPTLTDGTVTLRAVTPKDVPAIVAQSTDAETVRWTTLWEGYTAEDAREFVERVAQEWQTGDSSTWAVEQDGRFAGLVTHRRRGDGVSELSFATHPAVRGRGVMTRAARLCITHAFAGGDEAVLWHANEGNFGSRRVAWRLGFTFGGTTSQYAYGQLRAVWSAVLRRGDPMAPRTPWLNAPTLEGDGIRLRAFSDEDGAALPAKLDPDAAAYMSLGMPTAGGFADWLLIERTLASSGEALSVAVADSSGNRLLGAARLSRLSVAATPGSGTLSYWLLDRARGGGVMGAALELLVPWALRSEADGGLGLHRVEAGYVLANRASGRVLRRAGFAPVGVVRQAMLVGSDPHDVDDSQEFDLLAEDDRDAQRVEPGAIPVIETERFRLRPWSARDVPGPDEGPDDDSRRFMPVGAHPDALTYPAWLRQREMSQDANEHLNWAVADRETDHALGNLTVFRLDPVPTRFQAEIGYWLHPPARGRGVLGEVMPAMIDHAFAPVSGGGLGLARLYAATDLDNAASQAVLWRAGFRRWGQDRYAFRSAAGEVTDGAYFELLATDERLDRRPRRVDEVTLEGNGIRLRPWRDDDAARVVEGCTDGRSKQWLAALPDPYTLEHAAAYIRHSRGQAALGTGLFLAVADTNEDVCVGSVAVMDLGSDDPTSGEVGYWAHPASRGRGMMTQAVGLLVTHAFRSRDEGGLGLRRLELKSAARNAASQHVAEANGFRRTGRQRQAERLGDGSYDDLVDYDLLADEADGG